MHIEVSTMLEVDGHVVNRDELIQRIEQLIGPAPQPPNEDASTSSSGLAPGNLESKSTPSDTFRVRLVHPS